MYDSQLQVPADEAPPFDTAIKNWLEMSLGDSWEDGKEMRIGIEDYTGRIYRIIYVSGAGDYTRTCLALEGFGLKNRDSGLGADSRFDDRFHP